MILELNGHELAMSDAFYYTQRWFTTIALQSQYFLPGQGPGFFGATPVVHEPDLSVCHLSGYTIQSIGVPKPIEPVLLSDSTATYSYPNAEHRSSAQQSTQTVVIATEKEVLVERKPPKNVELQNLRHKIDELSHVKHPQSLIQ